MSKKKLVIVFITIVVGIGMAYSPVSANSKPWKKGKRVYYLSLGTSLAAGVQADSTGESVVTGVSYPGFIAEALSEDIPGLRHVNLGCPGETSDSFIDGGICDYKRGSQFDQAIQFLRHHRRSTALITLDMGANDILRCVDLEGDDGVALDLACFADVNQNLVANMIYILKRLRWAAGPRVPIVAMNYYNPLAVVWFDKPDGPALAQQTNFLQSLINASLEGVYAGFHVPVADVAGAFMSGDLVTDDDGNFIPDSVDSLCDWTWMCAFKNIHPNAAGYAVIAEEFIDVLPTLAKP
jgi:lysophospholipase L1-like esterase